MVASDLEAPVTRGYRQQFAFVAWLLGVGVTLLIGEGAIRLVSTHRLIYNIEMVRYAKELKQRDPSGAVSHVHQPNASARLMGVQISLNSFGNRGPELGARSTQVKRVLVLGSSVTFGWGVDFPQVFTSVAQAKLNHDRPFGGQYSFEFANAGIGNYNTKFQQVLFTRQYPIVHPDLVVLHYFIRDVEPIGKGNDSPVLRYSYLAALLYNRFQLLSGVGLGRRISLIDHYRERYADDSAPWAETRAIVLGMKQQLERDHVPFLVMIVPDIHDLSRQSPYGALYARMESAFSNGGVTTLNTYAAFQERFGDREQDLWIQSDDPHPNAAGHALMADILVRYIVDHDPIGLAGSR